MEPRAILVLDGASKRMTLFLNPRNRRFVNSMFGPRLEPGAEAARTTGVDVALPRAELRDLDPILDLLRAVKSPREIAVIREATTTTLFRSRLVNASRSRDRKGAVSRNVKFISLDGLGDAAEAVCPRETGSPRSVASRGPTGSVQGTTAGGGIRCTIPESTVAAARETAWK